VNSSARDGWAVPSLHLVPGVLLLLQIWC
jgi:hypothetical protein